MGRIQRGVLGRRTGKGNSSRVQNHKALWKKGKCFESTALIGLGLASRSVTGVPSVCREKEVKSLWKGSDLHTSIWVTSRSICGTYQVWHSGNAQ